MTNGAGPSHSPKRKKKASGKKSQGKEPKASRKQKAWVSAGLAKEKTA